MSPEDLVISARNRDLDGIAVTNHDTMEGLDAVNEHAENIEVIPGAEISTSEGHMLAWFIDEVPETKDPLKIIEQVRAQGGFTCLAHPRDNLRQVFNSPSIYENVDFVEGINSRVLPFWKNKEARGKAKSHSKPVTGGSDAHFSYEVGRAFTETDLKIRKALEKGETSAVGRGGYFSGHIATKMSDMQRLFDDRLR